MSEKTWIVEVPTRGIQTYVVVAQSKAEAARRVVEGTADGVAHEITWHGRPRAVVDATSGLREAGTE